MVIHSALYGAQSHRIDVAKNLISKISNDPLQAYVGNHVEGDPCPGIVEDIIVKYSYHGNQHNIAVPEGDNLILP